MTLHDKTNKQNFLLLIQLRWIAVGGQVVTILFVRYGLGIGLPLTPMAVVILLLTALNVASLLRHSSQDAITNMELFLGLLLDVAALTVQLYLSGGASNPFISLYLLQVILGAVLIETWSVWALVLITSACFVALTSFYREISLPHAHGTGLFSLHIQGMFICFVLAATLLVLFITRVQHNLRTRDAHLADLRQQSAEEDHIVRMGLLASGAAHELGTPLATLSVILNDWGRMPALQGRSELTQEIREMQGQLARCKTIVSGILMSSGETRGENPVRTSVDAASSRTRGRMEAIRRQSGSDYINVSGPTGNRLRPGVEAGDLQCLRQCAGSLGGSCRVRARASAVPRSRDRRSTTRAPAFRARSWPCRQAL